MSFIATGLLAAGVLAASIPILIHLLLRRRTRPVEWAAMSILIEAARRHRSRSRIERILLLIIRTLMVVLLGAALAQPIIGERLASIEPTTHHLVIDDGIMSGVRTSTGQSALEVHVAEAVKIIDSLGVSDRVSVTLAGRPVRNLVSPPTTDHRSIIRVVEGLQPREGATDLGGAVKSTLTENDVRGPRSVHVLSEYRRGTLDDRLRPTSTGVDPEALDLRLSTPGEGVVSSVRIESLDTMQAPLSLASEGDLVFVTAALSREGSLDPATTTVRLSGDAVASDLVQQIDWSAGEQRTDVEFRIRVDEDGGVVEASIDDGDALELDDRRSTILGGRGARRILMVGRGGFGGMDAVDRLSGIDWFERALIPDRSSALGDVFDVDRIDPISLDQRDLEGASIIVIGRPDLLEVDMGDHLARWADAGGILVVLPPDDEIARPWAGGLLTSLGLDWSIGLEPQSFEPARRLARQQPASEMTEMLGPELSDLAASVSVDRHLSLAGFESGDVVLVDDGGDPVVIDAAIGNGRLILFTVAPVLGWTDLPVRPLMVPLVQELVRQATAITTRTAVIEVGEGTPKSGIAFTESGRMPDGRIVSRQDLDSTVPDRSGIIEFLDVSGKVVDRQVVNAAAGSVDLRPSNRSEIVEWMSGLGEWSFTDTDQVVERDGAIGSNLSTILIALVLLLALADLVLSRWFVRGGLVTTRRDGLVGANAKAEADRSRRLGAGA